MLELVPIALVGWIPVVVGLFLVLPPRRAVIVGFLVAWLFLPMAGIPIKGLPDYTKMTAACVGVLLAAFLFDGERLMKLRPGWIDLFMIAWCLCPYVSSIANGLGAYDGASSALAATITWGFPYLIGRVYFGDTVSLRDLAIALFAGGLIYVPLCLYEIRMSPQLHHTLYGYHAHDFAQTIRMGGWRPTIFMQHGLMVGMWMAMTALIGLWLCWTKSITSVLRMPAWPLAIVLLVTAILCKSLGAMCLLAGGLGALGLIKLKHTRLAAVALLLFPLAYVGLRASGMWDGGQLLELTGEISAERTASLEFRLKNENLLITKAMEQPWTGWAGWGRNRVYDAKGNDLTVIDGMWIDTLGKYGLLGLGAFLGVFLVPPFLLLYRVSGQAWTLPNLAPVIGLAMLLVLYVIDSLFNAMVNPVYVLAAGGLTGVLLQAQPAAQGARRRARGAAVGAVPAPLAPR
ncbi:MAG: hypothetical protein WD042_17545 [Phycisphaeraceae bacterium]